MANLHVRDLLTSKVVSVRPDESISKVEALMDRKRIRHVPVIDDATKGVTRLRHSLFAVVCGDDRVCRDAVGGPQLRGSNH